jgi:hypothetical protein
LLPFLAHLRSSMSGLNQSLAHCPVFGVHRQYPEPPGYRSKKPRQKPKLGSFLERIAQIIEDDKAVSKKQRHTSWIG